MITPDQAVGQSESNTLEDMEALLGLEEGAEQTPEGETQEGQEGEELDGAPDGETDDEGKPADDGSTFTVLVDGKETKVSKDELVGGYLRTSDYTRKTQQLADQRRTAQAELEAAGQERNLYRQTLAALDQRLREIVPQEPDWETLRQTDPIEFATQHANHQRINQERFRVQQEQVRVQAFQQQQEDVALQRQLASEMDMLPLVIPEWADGTKKEAGVKALREYGKSMGISDEELGSIYDHRAILLMHKAMKYDALQTALAAHKAGTGKAVKKTLPPGSVAPRGSSTAYAEKAKRLAQSGKVRDAAAVFEAFV